MAEHGGEGRLPGSDPAVSMPPPILSRDTPRNTGPRRRPPLSSGKPAATGTVTVGQFFGVLKRRFPTAIIGVLIGLAIGALLLGRAAKSYESTAVVNISPVFGTTQSSSTNSVNTTTESKIVASSSVAIKAKDDLKYPGTAAALAAHVTVSSPLDSQVLDITYTSSTAKGAAAGANAFAEAYLNNRTVTAQSELKLRIANITRQLDPLLAQLKSFPKNTTTEPTVVAQLSALNNQITPLASQLATYRSAVVTPGQVAGVAAVPSSPNSPKPYLYLAGGLLFGLVLGCILAVVRDRRDDRVRTAADVERNLDAPVIVETASSEVGKRSFRKASLAAVWGPRGAEADAYRTISTTLTSDPSGSRVVMLCGTGGEKFSLAPLNLAATFALQGLVTAVAGPQGSLAEAWKTLQAVDIAPRTGGSSAAPLSDGLAASAVVPGLYLLSLGDEVNLGATLRANGDTLDDVLKRVDIIVLDGVNIELPSSSLRLGQLADEAVVVVHKNRTTNKDVSRLARHLAQVGNPVLGAVLLGKVSGLRGRRLRRSEAAQSRHQPNPDSVALARQRMHAAREATSSGSRSGDAATFGSSADLDITANGAKSAEYLTDPAGL